MARLFKRNHSHQDPAKATEPLVDINNTEPGQPAEPGSSTKPRRKRLSDVQESTDAPQSESVPQPEPAPKRQRLSVAKKTDLEDIPHEHPSPSLRPRISVSSSQTAVLEAPDDEEEPRPAQNDAPAPADAEETAPAQLDPVKIEQWIADLRARQNILLAAGGGVLAAVVGALIWAVISVTTHYQISWMAVGVGMLVGGVIRAFGRGLDKRFGYLGAGLSLFSCVLGNYLANCMFIAQEVDMSVASVLTEVNPAAIPKLLMATFHPVDVVFYGVALYIGYYFSFRRITEAQINRAFGGR